MKSFSKKSFFPEQSTALVCHSSTVMLYLLTHLWPSSVWTRASSTLKPGLEPAAWLMRLAQNAVARLITGCQSADECISRYPSVSIVRWLARSCVSTMVTAAGRRPLRSADNRTCLVKRSRNQFGDRCFAIAVPSLRQPDITFGQFKRSLKTFMFG